MILIPTISLLFLYNFFLLNRLRRRNNSLQLRLVARHVASQQLPTIPAPNHRRRHTYYHLPASVQPHEGVDIAWGGLNHTSWRLRRGRRVAPPDATRTRRVGMAHASWARGLPKGMGVLSRDKAPTLTCCKVYTGM